MLVVIDDITAERIRCRRVSLRAWTSVMPHLQYQLASHPTPLQALMRRGSAFERKSFCKRHLQVAGLNKVGRQLEYVAVRLDQGLQHTQAAPFRLSLQLIRGIAGHLEQETAATQRVKQQVDVVASDQVEHNIDLARIQRLAIRATGGRDHSSPAG